VERIRARPPQRLTLDKAGYFVVYPDARSQELMVEHYSNQGVLDCVLEGSSPASLYSEAIARKLLTRLDHAAYLGRELAGAEQALKTGEPFIQDKAPGNEGAMETTHAGCGCGSGSCHGGSND
jgi:tetrahydromethanopterin S-methyltransferase subunit A